LVPDLSVLSARHLLEVVAHLNGSDDAFLPHAKPPSIQKAKPNNILTWPISRDSLAPKGR